MERIEPSNIRILPTHGFNDIGAVPPQSEVRAPIMDEAPERRRVQAPAAQPATGGVGSTLAMIFTLFWLGGLGAYLVGFLGMDGIAALAPPWWGLIGAAAVVPIVFVWFIAFLAREARMLRQQAGQLAQAAQSLLEPEEQAAKSLQRLGRSVRREVDLFNGALETAVGRMTMMEVTANERLGSLEKASLAAQERVDRAATRLGAERDKLAQFTQALDGAVMSISETLTARLNEARTAARVASESLQSEQGAITGLIETLKTSATVAATKASETAREIERQAQRLDAASEAAAARSEQVVARHERQRAALAETIDRLKVENDHMARAVEGQRDGMSKLILVIGEEAKRLDAFAVDGVRRLDQAAAMMAHRITETTSLFVREADKLRTSTELTTAGLEQAMTSIRHLGDNSFDAAGRLGSTLNSLRDTAAGAAVQVEGTIARMGKMLQELPAEAAIHTQHLRAMLEQQSSTITDLSSRVSQAYDKLQSIEATPRGGSGPSLYNPPPMPSLTSAPPPSAALPPRPSVAPPLPHQPAQPSVASSVPNFSVTPPGGAPMNASPTSPHLPQRAGHHAPLDTNTEPRGWFGLAKRFVRFGNEGPDVPPVGGDRGGWDIKSLLAAAEERDRETSRGAPAPAATDGYHTSSRHMIETLQAMAIDLDRFLEDDPPLDLLRRYRNGERNVFARRLVSVLGREQADRISRKYKEDIEFKDTVDRYIDQFEQLMEETAGRDRENVLAETYLTSQTGKVYVMLASAIGRLS